MHCLVFVVFYFTITIHHLWANQCTLCGFGTICDGRGCTCRTGFDGRRWSPTERQYVCKDINECSGSSHRCKTGTRCVNREGAYDCRCRWGWYGPWVTAQGQFICTEKSLCDSVYHRCGSGTQCVATNTTSYRCMCSLGFTSRTISQTDEIYTCSDIDECTETRVTGPVCGDNSLCTNTLGSFRCKCIGGYQSTWKDDMNCNIEVTTGQSTSSQKVDFYKIGLSVGIGVVVLALAMFGLCFILKQKCSKKSSVKRRFQNNGQPIKISVLAGRESGYVNVILTSHEDKGCSQNVTVDNTGQDSSNKQHIYTNELLELEVNLRKDQDNSSEKPILAKLEASYVNHDTIKKARRMLSQEEKPKRKTNIPRPFSDSSVCLSNVSKELNQRFSLLKQKSESGEVQGGVQESVGEYDRLQRGSTVSPQPSIGRCTDHIYASPDDSDDSDSPLDSGSVFDIYQPIKVEMGEENSSPEMQPNTIYEPVIYSVPNKSAKRDRIYANQNFE